MTPAVITLIILAVAAVLFITEIIPLAVTAMAVAVTLALTGVLTVSEAFAGLTNENVILFAGMFVVGAGLFETGVAKSIGDTVTRFAKTETMLITGIMIISAVLSSFLSNTGTAAVLMPVVISIAASAGYSRSRLLMPLAFAAGLGGINTLIGTPPNLIVKGALETAGLGTFGFFEYAVIGIPLTVAGIIYMCTIGKKLVPDRGVNKKKVAQAASAEGVTKEASKSKQLIAVFVLIGTVLVMIFTKQLGISLHIAAIIGALVLVITGVLNEKQVYKSIDWTTIFLFAGMLPLADAMVKTGAGQMIADLIIGLIGTDASPYVLTGGLFLLSSGLTQVMSNTASTTLLAPIGIAIAQGLGADPKAVLMAIAVAASCAFATPVGTPPNTLVLGPGNFRFIDYIKVGLPLIVICFIISVIILPLAWPFY